MKRINGRIDVLDFVGNYQKSLKNGQIKEAPECTTKAYWIRNLDGKNYLFKAYGENNQMYRSLLVQKIADQVGISFARSDLAMFGYYDGELVEDYRKEGYQYISGSKILAEYYEYIKSKQDEEFQMLFPHFHVYKYDYDEILLKMNNLVTIEHALLHHYRRSAKKQQITNEILKELKRRFCLDFLVMQRDRGHHNWEVEETKDLEYGALPPLIDSNQSFCSFSFQVLLNPTPNLKVSSLYEKLELVLEDKDYELFYTLYDMFPVEEITRLLEEIQEERHFHMERESVIEIVSSYEEHYQKLTEIIEKKRGRLR